MGEDVNFDIVFNDEPILDITLVDGGSSGPAELPMIPRTFFPSMEAGNISEEDGSDVDAIDTFRSMHKTQYRRGASISFPTGYSGKVFMYDSDSYIGCTENWVQQNLNIPACNSYRILVKSEDIDDFTNVDNQVISVTDYDTIQNRFDLVFNALITRIE